MTQSLSLLEPDPTLNIIEVKIQKTFRVLWGLRISLWEPRADVEARLDLTSTMSVAPTRTYMSNFEG